MLFPPCPSQRSFASFPLSPRGRERRRVAARSHSPLLSKTTYPNCEISFSGPSAGKNDGFRVSSPFRIAGNPLSWACQFSLSPLPSNRETSLSFPFTVDENTSPPPFLPMVVVEQVMASPQIGFLSPFPLALEEETVLPFSPPPEIT